MCLRQFWTVIYTHPLWIKFPNFSTILCNSFLNVKILHRPSCLLMHCTEIIIYTSMHVLLTHINTQSFYTHELKHSNDLITPVRVAFVVSLQSQPDQGRISPHQTSSTNPQLHPKMYNKLAVTSYILQCKYDCVYNCTTN